MDNSFLVELLVESVLNAPLKALWWKDPYAWLMLEHNKVETRTWNTNYRGWVLMCCSKESYDIGQIMDISGYEQTCRIAELIEKNRNHYNGHAFALGRLWSCKPMSKLDTVNSFVEYNPNLYCHFYNGIIPIEPFELKGKQRWWNVTEEVKSKIKPLII